MLGDVNRYRIRGLLGQGGMAQVFEAQAIAAGGVTRRVAIKRLVAGHEADPDAARMFLDEARIASHLHHGAIVALLDYGVHDGQPFQVLELVDGLDAGTLRRLGESAGAPMPAEVALHLTAEVATALHYAHHVTDESGRPLAVVHRDVKPSNILVSWNGDVKLADFGIASALLRAERTLDGGIKGTPAYMGPEQLRGEPLDGRADIFALGCTLCALLTGASPLTRTDAAARLLRGEELPPDPDLPPEEAAILARAVHPRPADRFATAGQLAEALGDLLAHRIRKSPRSVLLDWLARVRPTAPRNAPSRPPLSTRPDIAGPPEDASDDLAAAPEGAPDNPSSSSPPPRRARFDALLGLDLEPDTSVPEARRFVTRTAALHREPPASAPSPPEPPPQAQTRPGESERHGRVARSGGVSGSGGGAGSEGVAPSSGVGGSEGVGGSGGVAGSERVGGSGGVAGSEGVAPSSGVGGSGGGGASNDVGGVPAAGSGKGGASRRWLQVGLVVAGVSVVGGVGLVWRGGTPGGPAASANGAAANEGPAAGASLASSADRGGSGGADRPVSPATGGAERAGDPPFFTQPSSSAGPNGAVGGAFPTPGPAPGGTGSGAMSAGVGGPSPVGSAPAAASGEPASSGVNSSSPAGAQSASSGANSASPASASSGASAGAANTGAATLDPVAAPTTGFVVIRGPGSVGAEIRVNGGSRGFAPKRLELPLGSYSVDLVLKDGRHLGPRGMSVTPRHTRTSPLAWDVGVVP